MCKSTTAVEAAAAAASVASGTTGTTGATTAPGTTTGATTTAATTEKANFVDIDIEGKDNSDDKSTISFDSVMSKVHGGLDSLSSSEQLLILSITMFLFFGAHNLLQEAIMKIPDFKYGVMLGYMEVLGVTIWSYLERTYVSGEKGRVAPLSAYPFLTLCLMGSSALSTMSLNYINFPTKVVFRSCKLLPTMFVATIINKRTFSKMEYLCAFAVCAGLVVFAAADWRLMPSFNPIGLVLVSLSVIADSITPNMQENLFKQGCTRLEVTLYSNFFTLVAMTFTTILSGDLVGILKHAMVDRQLMIYMIIYTTIAYVAISAFMGIVKRFGAVIGVLLSTARKGMTLILSFLLFPKAFSWWYLVGALLVLGGLLASSMIKQKKKAAAGKKSGKKINSEIQPLVKDEVSDVDLEMQGNEEAQEKVVQN